MSSVSKTIEAFRPDLAPYEELYKYFHAHPELSFLEKETAAKIVEHLKTFNAYEIFPSIGGHGVAAVIRNGEGKKVLLRADIDALPVEEQPDLPYASKVRMKDATGVEKPVMHACGHDIHITGLLAAAETLAKAKDQWKGTLILIFQPAEERGVGAQAMIDDGLYEKIGVEPDLCVGGHVVAYRAGVIGTKHGLMASSADSFHLAIHGRGAHASMPQKSIDPIIQASSTILRLQSIVSREVDPSDFAVVTVAAFHAGDVENIISDRADLKLDVRAARQDTRERVLASMKRIIDAEATASNAPRAPELETTRAFPLLFNDDQVTSALETTFASHFGADKHKYNANIPRLPGSEDFGILATSIGKPSCFFVYGCVDTDVYDKAEAEGKLGELPANHSPLFTPVIQPTLGVAVDAYIISALTFMGE
ncbi:metal-dependent amidase/aminoacylase/carboxypeptidase [Polyplosphaeria fusca]|uniref:Metal-dependent amidase/aminoacylase/carboxypeptidase n=1 Tax=Polyplosphaeria fusca TaxID=682080 RepID=A0A9P4V9F0_9PLEO|nr:metal-dependent amidase/aminoacylase/carboxypeptidase [Polyplosphaeria fusca]